MGMNRGRLMLWALGAAAALLIAYAWADGGMRPLRLISKPVALPGTAR